jgi:hypothetical protein
MTIVHHLLFSACEARIAEFRGAKKGVKSFTMRGDTAHLDRVFNKLISSKKKTETHVTAKAQIELSVVGSGVQQSRQIANSVKNDLKSIGESAGRAEVSLGKAGSALKAFGSGAGLGTGMSLLGLSGVIGFAATAGAIMAQSFKLAAEFERISQRSVFSMTYNTGAIASNLEAFKRRANGMSDLGINAIDAARMGASYGSASGRNPVYAMRSLGEWARSYGVQDLNAFGGQMGMISQYAGGDVNKNAAAFFGGASQAGDLGKRQGDIMGQLVNVLSSMNSSNPTGTASVRDAMREIVGVTSMGGFYQSTYGAGVTLSAEQKLGSGMLGDAYKTRMAMAAGLPLSAIINGTTNPVHLQAMAQQAYKWSHGNANMLSLNLAAAGFSEEQRRALAPLIMAKHGNILASDIKDADKRIGAYQGTKTGQLEQTMASLTNSEIHLGEGLMNSILPALKDLAQKIEGMSKSLDKMDFSKQVLGLEQHLDTLAAVLIATSIARGAVGLLKGGGMGFLRGRAWATISPTRRSIAGTMRTEAAVTVAATPRTLVFSMELRSENRLIHALKPFSCNRSKRTRGFGSSACRTYIWVIATCARLRHPVRDCTTLTSTQTTTYTSGWAIDRPKRRCPVARLCRPSRFSTSSFPVAIADRAVTLAHTINRRRRAAWQRVIWRPAFRARAPRSHGARRSFSRSRFRSRSLPR